MAGVNVDMIKWVIKGDINVSQTWSVGVWSEVVGTGSPTAADLDAAVTAVLPLVATWWGSMKFFNSAGTRYTQLGGYYYPAGSAVATISSIKPVTPVVGTGTFYQSPRNALVVSLLTGHSGRSYRGRAYVPMTAAQTDTTLQALATGVDSCALAHQTLLTALNAVSLAPHWGNAPTRVRSEKLGIASIITSIKVDSLIDTQRRREDKLTAIYSKTRSVP